MSSNPSSEVASAMRDAAALLDARPLDYYEGLSDADQVRSMREIQQLKARISAHEYASTRAIAASNAARSQGAASTGQLFANTFGGDRNEGDRIAHKAKRMGQAPSTEQALSKGLISSGQADVISATLAGLPKDVSDKDRKTCEDTLIALAPKVSIKDLRRRADRIADVYAPDKVDKIENQTLQDREKAAWAQIQFWMTDQNDGTHKGGFRLPDLVAEQLKKMVDVVAAPRNNRETEDDPVLLDTRPTASQRNGYAFAELIQRYPTNVLPGSAGVGAQLMITLDYDTLAGAVVPATLETGTRISAQEVMRLACELEILPAVFNGKALPTDMFREARLFNRAQRRALANRDHGCAFPGCDRPSGWCEAHHAGDNPWCSGGRTNLDEGVFLCAFHHRLIHHSDWEVRIVGDVPEFLPPAALDPLRRPRRNERYVPGLRRAG